MKITSFNPLIVTKDPESAIKLFEELGFAVRHTKEGISINNNTNVRMRDPNGFHVDITEGENEWTMIRMNVDDLDETVEFLENHGFHKARHAAANNTVDTGSSKINIMVSETGYILAVSQHIKEKS
ncbi:VOC family protein [Oribacterium sp. P6A1]|uniref:VOC family protein n=1 Tax=Oribacterium sp. P6A1 TaxID=1410612 RepID=UPI00055A33C5|nr:VOC family protein [Oribacterium sp. P6A1]